MLVYYSSNNKQQSVSVTWKRHTQRWKYLHRPIRNKA